MFLFFIVNKVQFSDNLQIAHSQYLLTTGILGLDRAIFYAA